MKKHTAPIKPTIKKYISGLGIITIAIIAQTIIFYTTNPHNTQNISTNAKQKDATLSMPPQDSNLPTIFRNDKNEISLSIQLNTDLPDAGQFDLFVSQLGYYQGTIPLKKSGKQIIHPQGTTNAQFSPIDNSLPTETTLRMEGEINTSHHTASINIWTRDKHFHLTSNKPDVSNATKKAKQVNSAITSQNWSQVYNSLSLGIQSSMTLDQLKSILANTNPKIIKSEIIDTGEIKQKDGFMYFIQPVTLTTQDSNGAHVTYSNTQFYILENGEWKLLSTDSPEIKSNI